MNYGLYVPNCGAFGDPHNVIQLAVDAEGTGWDGLFLWDHIAAAFVGGAAGSGVGRELIDPWVALAAAATATQRIRLGTAVTPVPRRRPHKLARETASLDRLSGGRVVLGVGTGEGDVLRLSPTLFTGEDGAASRSLDLDQPPLNAGSGHITPGSTWYFQFWYRDVAAGGQGFYATDGVRASFCL